MAERRLRVWALSDGQPGHYNQSRGIIEALRHLRPLQVSRVDVKLRFGLARNLLRSRLSRAPAPASLRPLHLFYRLGTLPETGCDLIVSAGGKTAFASAWIAAVLRVPNLYAGSLRGLSARHFSGVLTLEPVAGAPGNLVLPLPPSPIDAGRADQAGTALRAELGGPDDRYWTLLLGGGGAGYRYARDDWLQLALLMKALAHRHGVRWLLVSSRRTGRYAESLLKDRVDRSLLAAACWYGEGGEYHAEAWLGAAERVFVTEDSMTMLTEAMHSRRPVYSLRPVSSTPEPRYAQAMERFAAQRLVCRHDLAELSSHPEHLLAQPCRPLEASPTQWLAEQLRERLVLG
ncbi:MAG: ELM1/GtrOC1 family putative glycosyltransferase [Gammaproteobacteria bacterium]|jgi:mitochondrial fission protein ELM1